MTYELAHWFLNKSKALWASIWIKGFIGKLLFFPVNSILAILFILLSLVLYIASFMTILEKVSRGLFFFFKRKFTYAGFFGKILYTPFLLISIIFCIGIIIISIGQAMPFKQS